MTGLACEGFWRCKVCGKTSLDPNDLLRHECIPPQSDEKEAQND